jgi:predicted lipid-binding transport protein (Tim44 family)
MTGLIGGSLLLIIASAFALFFGWISADPNLMWVSIAASGMAAILLALGYGRSRNEIDRAVAIAMRKEGYITEDEARAAEQAAARATPTSTPAAAVVAPARAAPEVQPATAAMPALDVDGGPQVVAVPARKRYHRPECRFSAAKGAQTVSLAAAQRRGYDACGVCKP